MSAVFFVCILTGLIHFSETIATSMRLSGMRTRQVATSLSFVITALLISRLANMLQAPFLGGLVDSAIFHGHVEALAGEFRMIIFAAFVGNVIGAIALPSAVALFTGAIREFEQVGSIPRVFFMMFRPSIFKKMIRSLRLPSRNSFKGISLKGIPRTFLWLNVAMVSIYTVGVLSSLYAGALVPSFRTTASQLSAIVNGVATILLVLMVDPTAAHIMDQAVKGKRPEGDVRSVVFFLVSGRIIGTLMVSQLLFFPASLYIRSVTLLVKGLFVR